MNTVKKLREAYKKAKTINIDKDSKFVFFSDSHRGAGSLADEFTRNENTFNFALNHYYDNGFTLVEVGDGDELWEHRKVKSIKRAHYTTFKNIKRFYDDDRFIMLYGNHNMYLKNQDYVKKNYYTYYDFYNDVEHEFLDGIKPLEAIVLKVKDTNQEILFLSTEKGSTKSV